MGPCNRYLCSDVPVHQGTQILMDQFLNVIDCCCPWIPYGCSGDFGRSCSWLLPSRHMSSKRRRTDVALTSVKRHLGVIYNDVASTSVRRHFDVMCSLGIGHELR